MISPEYFDLLGIATFGMLLYVGISRIKKEKIFAILLIVIGVLGLLIDGYSIITNLILNP
jgi:hypothetical protein